MPDNRLPHSKILKILNEPEAADFLADAISTAFDRLQRQC
jgi:hypothetical protein